MSPFPITESPSESIAYHSLLHVLKYTCKDVSAIYLRCTVLFQFYRFLSLESLKHYSSSSSEPGIMVQFRKDEKNKNHNKSSN